MTAPGETGAASVCPHCGFDPVAQREVVDGDWRYSDGSVFYRGQRARLGPSRSLIIGALMKAHGRLLTKDALLGAIGAEDTVSNVIEAQMSHLRVRLRALGIPVPVETVWGRGFRWNPPASVPSSADANLAGGGSHAVPRVLGE